MDAAEPRRARRGRESTAQTRTEGIRREKGCQQPCPASMTASAEAGWSGEEYDGLLGERKRGGGKVQGLLTERQGKSKGNERPRRRMNWVVRLAWVEEGRGGGGAALVVEGRPSKEARRRRSEGGWKGRGGWENDEGEGRGRKAARGPSEKDARRKPRQRLARGRFTARSPPRHCLDPPLSSPLAASFSTSFTGTQLCPPSCSLVVSRQHRPAQSRRALREVKDGQSINIQRSGPSPGSSPPPASKKAGALSSVFFRRGGQESYQRNES